MSDVYGQQGTTTAEDDYSMLVFTFGILMQKIQTATLVEVVDCTNSGDVVPVGTCTVQPLVNQMTGQRQPVPHGKLFNCVYQRMAAGPNAIIMDPQPGDIGLMVFCSRDISQVIAQAGQANPGSFRMFSWSDGVLMSWLPRGKVPTQFLQFVAGITAGTPVLTATGNVSVATGDSGTLTDSTGQVAVFQDGICVSIT